MVTLAQLPLAVLRRMLADTERSMGADSQAAAALRREIERRATRNQKGHRHA